MAWGMSLCLLLLGIVLTLPVAAVCDASQQSCSTNYGVTETFFGSGGELNACSSHYCSKQSLGETTVGNTKGTSYQAQAGFNTNREEYLQFTINAATVDLGVLNSATTATGTATFSVEAYLANGYQVVTTADPPTNNSYVMHTPSTPTASAVGTEQFGINLVANTSPAISGSANPVQVPDGTFSYGQAAPGYDTPNLFKYTKGDVVASSTKSSGETDFTISYIMNISGMTPGGHYVMQHQLVATATF